MHTRRWLSLAALAVAVACGGSSRMSNPTGVTGGGPGGSGGGSGGGGGGGGSMSNAVTVGNNFFSPTSNVVAAGTTVTWTWNPGGVSHNITFDDGMSSSGPQNSGTFTRTFTARGTYTYFCSIHGRAVMSGTITVQ